MAAPTSVRLDERQALGLAIKALRQRGGLTQAAAAERLGVETQTWKRYEWGHRNLHLEQLDRIARALDCSREDILREKAVIEGAPLPADAARGAGEREFHFEVQIGGRARAGTRAPMVYDAAEQLDTMDLSWLASADTGFLRVSGESETGYVESGQVIIYRRSLWPRKGEGCVIETHDGELYVKEYAGIEGDDIVVTQRFPEARLTFPRAEVKGVYKVWLRGG